MSQSQTALAVNSQPGEGRWRSIYRIGAVATVISFLVIPLSFVAFFLWPSFPEDILA